MILYLDSSAFAKRHAPDERDSRGCSELIERFEVWVTSRISAIEVPRALHRSMALPEAVQATRRFDEDLRETNVIAIDADVSTMARDLAIREHVKSLDAIHLASALTFPPAAVSFLTYDRQQARVARALGFQLAH